MSERETTVGGAACDNCGCAVGARPVGTLPDTADYAWVCWDCFRDLTGKGPADV